MTDTHSLSTPDANVQQHSDRLSVMIQHQIDHAGGSIPFADYMHACLYTPELGYYSSSQEKIGQLGDFTTAPEMSPLFSRSLCRHIIDVLSQLPQADVLEFGAGNGNMAADILLQLDKDQQLPHHYYIIEASAYLQIKQQETIKQRAPQLFDHVVWLTHLPEQFNGVIIANEVCDAMPFARLHYRNEQWTSGHVSYNEQGFFWSEQTLKDSDLLARAKQIAQLIPTDSDYITEVNLRSEAWLATLADLLTTGALFIVDYGYTRHEYYHPERQHGTLMCYYQHQGHDDPFFLPGLQDITSHVDFTALAEVAHERGLDVAGFHSQADFLIAGDLTSFLAEATTDLDTLSAMQYTAAAKQLVLPSAMGEQFKVLSLSKQLPSLLPRLQRADRRYQL